MTINTLKKYKRKIGGISALLLITACGGGSDNLNDDIALLHKMKDSLRNEKNEIAVKINEIEEQIKLKDSTGNHRLPLVTVIGLNTSHFKHFFGVQGVVESDQNTEINPEVSAKITSINVFEGKSVKKGDAIAILDSRVLENSISELKTQRDLAQTLYNKQEKLWDQKIGSEMQYLEAKTNLEGLDRKLQTLNSQLAMYTIRAPFDGIVDEIFPKAGEMATPMMPIARLINLDHVYIKSDISENYLGKIEVGDTALINFPSNNYKVKTTISRIGNFINPNNRTFKVRFEIENKEGILKPNLLAQINIMDYEQSAAVVIPIKVIQETPLGEEFVFVLHENGEPRVEKRIIESGMSYQGQVEIKTGLKEGEKLVTQGGSGVKDGDIVDVNQL